MGIIAAYAVPHPPLIIPTIGRGQERDIQDTIEAFKDVSARMACHSPETIVIVSPHAPAFRDGFFISRTSKESGSMANFGQPQESMTLSVDEPFAQDLASLMESRGLICAPASDRLSEIDHGAYIPLYFINHAMDISNVRVVRIGLSALPAQDHRVLGELIAKTAEGLERKCVLVASGDWSHKLKEEGPYGFAPEGPVFDSTLRDIFESGSLDRLFEMDPDICEKAAECGLRSFQIMAGALEGSAFSSELLSYEGPFGVGYGVAAFEIDNSFGDSQDEVVEEDHSDGYDPLVELARNTIDAYITDSGATEIPGDFPKEYLRRKAGVFVSLHEHGALRGCIGTIEPRQSCIAEEVMANAISASTADPRFPAVEPQELDYLEYSVDVLGEPEKVDSLIELDPKRYGVIVTRGWRRGLLLPDLEGVDTVMDQIAIAKQKAGIAPNEDVELERFEVIRHNAGGAARKNE